MHYVLILDAYIEGGQPGPGSARFRWLANGSASPVMHRHYGGSMTTQCAHYRAWCSASMELAEFIRDPMPIVPEPRQPDPCADATLDVILSYARLASSMREPHKVVEPDCSEVHRLAALMTGKFKVVRWQIQPRADVLMHFKDNDYAQDKAARAAH